MRKRRSRVKFHEPSLVPLADMLTNTVGITVFILIFTVLTAGGVVMVKRLPLEHTTEAEPLHFVCTGGRVLPLDAENLGVRFMDPLGKPKGGYEFQAWTNKFNAQRIEDDFFVVTGDAQYIDLGFYRTIYPVIVFTPREGTGDTANDLRAAASSFRKVLKENQPTNRFVNFLVRPDGVDIFLAARSVAIDEMNYSTGWSPLPQDKPIRFGSGGRASKPQ
jgi:hypothetical protein